MSASLAKIDLLRFAQHTVAAAAMLVTCHGLARADPTKGECVDADTRAQGLRREGKFALARRQLEICAAAACPALVRDDCAQRIDELERVQPTIVFEAKDGAGHDLSTVSVVLDGQPWLDRLGGNAVPIDPGVHTFRFQAAQQPPVILTLVLREGTKARRERVVIGEAPSGALVPNAAASSGPIVESTPAPSTGPAPAPVQPLETAPTLAPQQAAGTPSAGDSAPPAYSDRGRPLRVTGLVVGAVGVAGLAVGSVAGVIAASLWNQAKSECPSPCGYSAHNEAENNRQGALSAATASTIAFVAGGVLAATGVAFYLAAPPGAPREQQHGLRIVPALGTGGGGLALEGDMR